MFNTELGIFCNLHKDWRELLSEEPYCLKIKEDTDYVIFNYDQIRSDFSLPIVREARGIIFKKDHWKNPVCWAFDKFGNYGESYVPDIDWHTAFVTEKVDGSLIKVWWDWDGGWHVSTNGVINAFDAPIMSVKVKNFGDYFYSVVEKYYKTFDNFTEGLDHDYTYMFELVGPYNRVVIPYEEPDIYFLGARNKYTGEILKCTGINAGKLGIDKLRMPKMYLLNSLEECLKVAEKLTWDQEGFVVVDAKSNRAKIKSPAYVLAHFARNNNVITRKHLIKVILMNEVEEFLCYASDYEKELRHTQVLMNAYHNIGETLAKVGRKASILSRAAYADIVKTYPELFHDLLFKNYDKDCYAREYTCGWNENKWDDCLSRLEVIINEYIK